MAIGADIQTTIANLVESLGNTVVFANKSKAKCFKAESDSDYVKELIGEGLAPENIDSVYVFAGTEATLNSDLEIDESKTKILAGTEFKMLGYNYRVDSPVHYQMLQDTIVYIAASAHRW